MAKVEPSKESLHKSLCQSWHRSVALRMSKRGLPFFMFKGIFFDFRYCFLDQWSKQAYSGQTQGQLITRGGRFNFLLTPMGGWVGVKPAAPGVFLVQRGRFLVVQKFKYLNLGSNI